MVGARHPRDGVVGEQCGHNDAGRDERLSLPDGASLIHTGAAFPGPSSRFVGSAY